MKARVVLGKDQIKGEAVFALSNFKKGELVIEGKPIEFVAEPTWLTLQVAEDQHLFVDKPFAMVNHSCSPNCGIAHNELGAYNLVALADINEGEEITFDYAMSEWDCVANFHCQCGALNCRGQDVGAKYVDAESLQKYVPYLSNYILKMLAQKQLTKTA